MKLASAIRVVAASALIAGVLPVAAAEAASTVVVSQTNCSAAGPGTTAHPYCTIQQGVNAASPGDTVRVNKGTYTGGVVVDKTISLEGNQATVTAAGADGMDLEADSILVIGFTFTGKTDGPAVYTSSTHSGYTIRNNTFTNNVFGLYLHTNGSRVTVVRFNHFTANNVTGASNGNGIYSDQGLHNVTVEQNVFENQDNAGMLVANGGPANDNIRFSRNLVQNGNGIGLLLDQVSLTTVSNNTFRNLPNGNAVYLVQAGSNNTVSGNVMQKSFRGLRIGNPGIYGPGVQTNLLVQNNTITQSVDSDAPGGSNAGIYVAPDSMQNSTLFNNTSNSNLGDGILIDSGANTGNSIDSNTARNNGNLDAEDRTTGGSGTAGTQNNWDKNHCVTSSPLGLCSSK